MNRNLKEQLKKKSRPYDDVVESVLSSPWILQLHLGTNIGIADDWDWSGKCLVEPLFVVSRTWPPLSSWLLSGLLLLSATLVWKSSCLGCQAGKSFPKANKYRLSTWISSVWCKPLFPQSRSKLNFLFWGQRTVQWQKCEVCNNLELRGKAWGFVSWVKI